VRRPESRRRSSRTAAAPTSLSEKQKYVFKIHVMDEYVTSECSRCGSDIPWSEMYTAHDNGGMCSWCWHMTNKDD
jgi:hypothetical protein